MRKLTLTDPIAARLSIREMVKNSRDQHLLHQLHCVQLVGLGRTCKEVANWFGDTTRTVERWVCAFNNLGVEGLCHHQSHGRPPRVVVDVAQRLAFELKQPPRVCGFADAHWSGKLLKQHLISHFGVTMSLRQSQRILKRLTIANQPKSHS
jgi:transposase